MHRFFVSPGDINKEEGKAIISGDTALHISRVLRLQKGDSIILADGSGNAYLSIILYIEKYKILAELKEPVREKSEPATRVILAQGLAKGEKMDHIVQKCTELGIAEIIPLVCERTVVRLSSQKVPGKIKRWQKISLAAAEQSQRDRVPTIKELSTIEEVLSGKNDQTLCLFLWEQEKKQGLKEILSNNPAHEVLLLVGPEGGFSEAEADFALSYGAFPVTLGPRVLRTETASPAALTMVLYELDDLGGVYE